MHACAALHCVHRLRKLSAYRTLLLPLPCAQIFFSVYEMAIDTMLLCLCEDCESNGGHPRYAPKLLLEAIGESAPPADHEKPQQRWT